MRFTRRKFIVGSLGAFASLGTMGAYASPKGKGNGKPPPKHTTTSSPQTSVAATTTTAVAATTTTGFVSTTTVVGARTPEQYGAVGDGVHDDTAAVQSAFNAGGTIQLANTYRHTAVLVVGVNGTTVLGPGTLLATNPDQSAVKVTGANVTFDGVNLWMHTASPRLGDDVTAKLWLSNCSGATIRNTHVDGSGSAGIFMKGASNYLLEDCTVANTLADGIHNTHGSHDGIIRRCSCSNVGDDGFAVVSYQPDGVVCYNISFESPRFYGNTWGRGFSVVGGHDITWTDIYGQDSDSGMIYFSSEGSPWNTYATERVTLNGGSILRSNKNSSIDHGAVVLTSYSGFVDSDINIHDLNITDTRSTCSRQVGVIGTNGSTIRTTFTNFTIVGGPSNLLVAQSPVRTSGWTFNGNPVPPITGW